MIHSLLVFSEIFVDFLLAKGKEGSRENAPKASKTDVGKTEHQLHIHQMYKLITEMLYIM